jgi:hypothetical protein
MLWRIEPINDPNVEYLIPRDTDTRIQPREVMAVQEWVQSGKSLHIMRDHFQHFPKVLGGMFGIRCSNELKDIDWIKNVEEFYEKNPNADQIYMNTYRNSFVSALAMAYNFHLPLVLSPNAVWLAVL